ncbi:docking domain of Afi1 for Arf3 in vesicle trafficking-domain-containing protein [Scheffersomyces coipomensis]|uniref:docking domain of Afi1 for Arf3 in vesicle trafficking-domain-containing protein n=1 Tax=Scheffersomyces coipomensis TaxID=1788519 RepID=UPI00315D5026
MPPNIDYILTAEFHIDKGPSITHQYPSSLPGIDNLYFLPELMLPDQIHKRNEDFTVFLLYRNTYSGEFQYLFNKSKCEPEPYFLYTIVINVKDSQFKRGSIIKSLSIITKLAYFKSFKPLLLIALDKYFKDSDELIIKDLYHVINEKNFEVATPLNQMSIVKKLLITSILDLPIQDKIYHDELFRNKILGIGKDNLINKELFIRKDLSFNSVVDFNNMKIPIKIPMIELPDTFGDYLNPTDFNFKPNLINILQSKLASDHLNDELTIYGLQTPPIIIFINAILTGKKILVLSYDNSAGHIIDNIFLLLKLVSGGGILTGILANYNVFPMIDVSKIDLLEECDSFIAGTINPFFKSNDKLWDLLYDLDNNEVIISSTIAKGEDEYDMKNSIISEDAKFLSNLQLSIFNYNDDLTTIQLIFRRHINEIIRILLSSRNLSIDINKSSSNQSPNSSNKPAKLVLLMEGIGYFWNNDTNKLLEISTYQLISKKFQDLLYDEKFYYSLHLPNLGNELNLMIDLHYQLQSLNNSSGSHSPGTRLINEREIWFNILKYLISGKSLEILLLVTYLIPPSSSTSLQSSSVHGGSLTIFDKNKGIELLLINLFNKDDQVKSNVIMILQELQDNYLCGWCLRYFLKSNLIYEIAFEDLLHTLPSEDR